MPYTLSEARKCFGWLGRVIAVHEIGRYALVEYADKQTGASRFGGVIDGKPTSHSYDSIEHAMVGCVAIAAEGPNGSAADYFFRMIAPASSLTKAGA